MTLRETNTLNNITSSKPVKRDQELTIGSPVVIANVVSSSLRAGVGQSKRWFAAAGRAE